MNAVQTLVTLPPAAARTGERALSSAAFACSDPPGRQLGSGGGTAHLLLQAWKALGGGHPFGEWLADSRKLIIHASGQSRRLPAYAAEGKSRIPVPLMESGVPQTLGQTLLDLQNGAFHHLLRHAPASYRVAVTCGDTLVRFEAALPAFPEADVLIVGIPASPEEASSHGVLFTPPDRPGHIVSFLQKPSPALIREKAAALSFSLDSGVWLLSERAVRVLFRKCGLAALRASSSPDALGKYELYDRFGVSLGEHPAVPDAEIGELSAAVLPLPDARFYHFGTNRSVLSSVAELSHPAEDRRSFGHASPADTAEPRFVLHAKTAPIPESVRPLWIENATVPASWKLSGAHVLTGLPPNAWSVDLPRGVCVDAVPFPGTSREVLRVYGFDDAFKGSLSDRKTLFLGRPFADWLADRGLTAKEAGLAPDADLQDAPLFPLANWADPADGALLRWMVGAPRRGDDPAAARAAWLAARRVSATDLVQASRLEPRLDRREAFVRKALSSLDLAAHPDVAARLDLAATATHVASAGLAKSVRVPAVGLPGVHGAMFLRALGRRGPDPYGRLGDLIVGDTALSPVTPVRNVLDDQIVWGRSPARIDLAGGWSDTPPYCLEHGGRVVNVAVDLNGQPPVQVFIRPRKEPMLVLHSIDLGVSESIRTERDLRSPNALGPFSIPRAALRLAGFDPAFRKEATDRSLERFLRTKFGGGLEISTLAAIPKGSGLGTSSILAVAVLGVLNETCSLGWSAQDLLDRTSALEQLLTSGGGWQDQLGGLFPGAKLAITRPGLRQRPDIRFLPDALLRDLFTSGRAMLYYTGVTRVARSILAEIVRNLFLNDSRTVARVNDIACNADFCARAVQHADEAGLAEAIRRSWDLNRELDAGTNPPSIAPLADALERRGASFKLLGAGGGGYLFILAPDLATAAAIREDLSRRPPNPRARFVSPTLSAGLQITRS